MVGPSASDKDVEACQAHQRKPTSSRAGSSKLAAEWPISKKMGIFRKMWDFQNL